MVALGNMCDTAAFSQEAWDKSETTRLPLSGANPGLASARNFEIHFFPHAHPSSFSVFHPLFPYP